MFTLRWVEALDGSILARLGDSTIMYYQILPVLDDYQLVLATPGGVQLLGTHPTLEAAKAAATTHVGDDE